MAKPFGSISVYYKDTRSVLSSNKYGISNKAKHSFANYNDTYLQIEKFFAQISVFV